MVEPDTRDRKAAIRRQARARREQLGEAGRAVSSMAIARNVLSSNWWARARVVAAFVGIRDEPDTRPLLRHTLGDQKRLLLPRIASDHELSFVEITDLSQLRPAKFGLLEPAPQLAGVPLAQTGADIVLVPGLIFDRNGHRVGYGKGYYDRALEPLAGGVTVFAGMVYDACLLPTDDDVPIGPNDVPVHCVISERGIHWPGR